MKLYNYLIPLISEWLQEDVYFIYQPEEVLLTLNYSNWPDCNMFHGAEFTYEHARFTLIQLCNMSELFTDEIGDELRERIRECVQRDIDFRDMEAQRDLQIELHQAREDEAA